MRIRIQTTNDGDADDWVKIYCDNKLLVEGRKLTPYEIIQALSDRYPVIQLEPMRAYGYIEELVHEL